jgi:hypothetical protein
MPAWKTIITWDGSCENVRSTRHPPFAVCHFWFAICHFWFAVPEPTSSSPQPPTVNSRGPALIEALAF